MLSMSSMELNFDRRRLFWPQFNEYCRIWQATHSGRFSPNELNGWIGLPWTKVITIDSLNNGRFSFASFSSQPVMLMGRETPYTFRNSVLRISQRDLVLILERESMPVTMTYEGLVKTFDILNMWYLVVTKIIKQVNWNITEEKS
jgi:hypothetical protein